jgi:hypothetical protein
VFSSHLGAQARTWAASLGSNRRPERGNVNDGDGAAHAAGERGQAELSPDVPQPSHQEGTLVHQLPDGAQWLLDVLAPPIENLGTGHHAGLDNLIAEATETSSDISSKNQQRNVRSALPPNASKGCIKLTLQQRTTLMQIKKFMLTCGAVLFWSGVASAEVLFSPPLVADGDRLLDCYLANVGQIKRNVTITVLDAKGKPVAGPLAVTLAPGEEKVARAEAQQLGRYCKFNVPAPKSDYRASVLVIEQGVGAISALAANWRQKMHGGAFRFRSRAIQRRRSLLSCVNDKWREGVPLIHLGQRATPLLPLIAAGVDDAIWCHHLTAGDYSAWARDAIKDEEPAAEIATVEREHGLDAQTSRARVKATIERRYTGPASVDPTSRELGAQPREPRSGMTDIGLQPTTSAQRPDAMGGEQGQTRKTGSINGCGRSMAMR